MASSLIHIAIANEINKKIKKDKSKLLIGTISPDISKLVGETKIKSHFIEDNDPLEIPRLDWFLIRYKDYLQDDFVLGYYIHLYVDYLWFKYFITEIENKEKYVIKLDGTKVKTTGEMFMYYLYNDYTNLNMELIDKYNLDLKIFYNEIPEIKPIIREIPMDKLYIIVNKIGEIIENSKVNKKMIFDMDNIEQFINTSIDIILSNLKELGIYDKND